MRISWLSILLLGSAVSTFANTGFFFPAPSGFTFRIARQDAFVSWGYGSGFLPLCATPGTICNPNVVLTPLAGFTDFGRGHPHDPFTCSGCFIDVTGKPFLIPITNGTILKTLSFSSNIMPNSLGVIELTFSKGRLTDERLVLNPEPGSLVLFGTGLLAVLLFVRKHAYQ